MKKSVCSIVQAGRGDIAEIRSIALDVWPQVYKEILSADQISYMMDMMYSPQVIGQEIDGVFSWYLVKDADDVAAGYVSIYFPEDGVCKLDKIYIRPEFRNRGFGRAAVEHICGVARERGAKQLILNVNKYNLNAQESYRHFGFRQLKSEVNDIGAGFVMDDFVFALDI